LFAAPLGFELGLYPTSVATGDFDADGVLDLAITLLDENCVEILLGSGDATFQEPRRFAAGALPRGVVTADFDRDGVLDLAVSNVSDSTVCILEGLHTGGVANGQFAAPAFHRAGWENRGLAAFDLDGDAWTDLVVAGRSTVVVLRNRGDGGFEPWADLPTPGSWGVTAFRHASPSRPVLVAANWTHPQLDVFVGVDSAGSAFAALPPIPMPGGSAEITSGDLDGDGRMDLVAPGAAGLRVLLGAPTPGGFGPAASYESAGGQMNDAALVDMDADGRLDIAATDTDLQEVALLVNQGGGAFGAAHRLAAWAGPNGIEAGDADGDGRADLFAVNSGTQVAVPALLVYRGLCGLVEAPRITDVRDVPHDQGGTVFVTWLASGLDSRASRAIREYRVWRRIHPPGVSVRVASDFGSFVPGTHLAVARPAGAAVEYWEPIAEVPAAFLQGYGYTAATTQDSIAGSNPYTAFFVQALTADPLAFYSSEPDSGYSVDNLAPPAPMPFVAEYTPSGVALHWLPSPASDFSAFRLHRGASATFVPGAENLVVASPDTGYFDPVSSASYYKLAAVDVHGNVGRYSLVSPEYPTAALATFLDPELRDGSVTLRWYLSTDDAVACTVHRRTPGESWRILGAGVPEGTGQVVYHDDSVSPGGRYGYRLGVRVDGGPEVFAGEGWVDVPSSAGDLGPRVTNPVLGGDVIVSFAPPAGRDVRVELLDVAGRVLETRDVRGTGARQNLTLAPSHALAPGVYLVRIRLDRPVVVRVAVLR
jgi:hypothetical protein